MAKSQNYPELVQQAEQAVQGVKDPNLKSIAFQKVLEELLSGGTSSVATPRARTGKSAGKAGRGKTTRQPRGGPKAYVREMIEEHFFKKPKTITEVKVELENRGHHIPLTSLSGPLQQLCQGKELRRTRSDGKFVYSNW